MSEYTYADQWADEINRVYESDLFDLCVELPEGESAEEYLLRVLGKAAQCLRNGIPATFTASELDVVRHYMPAHEVHQSGSVRWVLNHYGEA